MSAPWIWRLWWGLCALWVGALVFAMTVLPGLDGWRELAVSGTLYGIAPILVGSVLIYWSFAVAGPGRQAIPPQSRPRAAPRPADEPARNEPAVLRVPAAAGPRGKRRVGPPPLTVIDGHGGRIGRIGSGRR
jgi:hypothetical protein